MMVNPIFNFDLQVAKAEKLEGMSNQISGGRYVICEPHRQERTP